MTFVQSKKILSYMIFILFVLFGISSAYSNDKVEVMHWWTSGSEAMAPQFLKKDLQSNGIDWSDMPIAGGGGGTAMTALRARVTAGNAPTAVQMLGFDIRDWAEQGVLSNLDILAENENWDKVIPEALKAFGKYDGHWISVPANIHSTNWIWMNKAALDATGGQPPKSWEELLSVLDKMQDNGIIPIAHGSQAWQDTTIFETIVLSLGADFYKAAMIDLDPNALQSDKMLEAFRRMEKLRSYMDNNISGRDWNLASAMVIEGKAGMQIMGDWAKGEFLKAGKSPNADFICIRFPGTQGSVTFNSDQFAMFQVSEEKQKAQFLMASAVMKPSFQETFNIIKGSVPARLDIPHDAFDDCGKKGMADLAKADAKGTLLGSMAHGYAAPAAIKNVFFDVVTRHFNGELSSEEAVDELMIAIEIIQ